MLLPSRPPGCAACLLGRGESGRGQGWRARGHLACLSHLPPPRLHSSPTQEVDAAEIQVQVCLYAFDLIYLNGEVSCARPRVRSEVTGRAAGLRAWERGPRVRSESSESLSPARAVVLKVGPRAPPFHPCISTGQVWTWCPEPDIKASARREPAPSSRSSPSATWRPVTHPLPRPRGRACLPLRPL